MGILSCQELVDGSEQHTPQDDGGVEDAWSVEDRRDDTGNLRRRGTGGK